MIRLALTIAFVILITGIVCGLALAAWLAAPGVP